MAMLKPGDGDHGDEVSGFRTAYHHRIKAEWDPADLFRAGHAVS